MCVWVWVCVCVCVQTPIAIDSICGRPQPSPREGNTKASAPLYSRGNFFWKKKINTGTPFLFTRSQNRGVCSLITAAIFCVGSKPKKSKWWPQPFLWRKKQRQMLPCTDSATCFFVFLFFWVNTTKKRFNMGTLAYSTRRQHKDICPPARLWSFFFGPKKIDTGNPALSIWI